MTAIQMTQAEFYAKYGDVEVTFRSYYKYTFHYGATLPDGKHLLVQFGGNIDDIYRHEVDVSVMRPVAVQGVSWRFDLCSGGLMAGKVKRKPKTCVWFASENFERLPGYRSTCDDSFWHKTAPESEFCPYCQRRIEVKEATDGE